MKFFIGIDLGGTKIEGILVNWKFKVLGKFRAKTEADKGRKKVLENICSVIDNLHKKKISAIGLAVPGNPHQLKIGYPNIPCLIGFDLKKFLAKKYGCRIEIENDANCFAIAEHKFGAGKNSKNMVGVIIGTGVGGGIIINDKLYTGSFGAAGEIGHAVIDPSGLRCNCGNYGDFESWCSGPNIVRRYTEKGGKMKNPETKRIFESDDAVAKEIIRETYKKIGIAFGNIINILNPEIIVVGGGVSNSLDYNALTKEAKKHVLPELKNNFKILKNRMGDSAGVLGATLLVNQ